MKIQVNVNQSESLKRGVNAPHSTVQLEVEPIQLSEAERVALSSRIKDGHRADSFGTYGGIGAIPTPDFPGLKERLSVLAGEDAPEREKQMNESATRIKLCDEIIKRGPIQGTRYTSDEGGFHFATLVFGWPEKLYYQHYGNRYFHDDVSKACEAAESRIADQVESDRVAAVAQRKSERETRLAAEEQSKSLRKTAIDAEAARLGEVFERKWKAGMAAEIELRVRLEKLECEQLGLLQDHDYNESESASLSDEEFMRVEKLVSGFPAGCEVDIRWYWNAPENEEYSEEPAEDPEKTKLARFDWTHKNLFGMSGFLKL